MNRALLIKIVVCIFAVGFCFYSYLNKKNELTALKLKLPKADQELTTLKEQIKKLEYENEIFENPNHLIEIARRKEFEKFKHPLLEEVFTIHEGIACKENEKAQQLQVENSLNE